MENRSAKRQALVIRLKDHPYFEEAHMICKDSPREQGENDMVKEATRIIAAYAPKGTEKQGRSSKTHAPLFYFICGMATALLLFVLSALLLLLVR
ncbi:MAG: hypothetical protein IJY89_01480 [Clostridia bacterium]|nr:hypothetical protein [Clostridia bacterium]